MNTEPITKFPNAPDIESSTWDYARRFKGKVGAWMLDRQNDATKRAFAALIPGQTGLNILDVGGGHGQNIDLLKFLGHDVTIYGSDERCKEVINERIDAGEVKFQSGSLLKLPFPDNSFDVVICYRVLSHMASWRELISELVRVSGGLVLVDYPCYRSVNVVSGAFYHLKKRIEKNTRPFVCFHDSEVDDAFEAVKAERRFRYRQFFLPMALHRLVDNRLFSSVAFTACKITGLNKLLGSPVISGYSVGAL